ncbi:hypothetical protein C8J57DRAFT_1514880 [Mycena rebaudengoi]|nr:hypothetical protein C8J57DRAFT_1514880 [Mycena rebaudengoi]
MEVDFLNVEECVEILRTAPEVMGCDVFYEQDVHASESHSQPSVSGNRKYLTLPALETLEIADFDITKQDFTAFLTHSAPPLTSLRMVMPTTDWKSPTTTKHEDDSDLFRTFLEVLRTTEDILPNLRNLTLWACFSACFSERTDYVPLISVLTDRRVCPRMAHFSLSGSFTLSMLKAMIQCHPITIL